MLRSSRVIATVMTALILPILLITTGCTSGPQENSTISLKENSTMTPSGSNTMKDAFDALLKRPSVASVDAESQSMFKTIRERLVAEVGVAEWVPDDRPISGSFCADGLSNLEGSGMHYYDAGTSPGNLPDARWDQALTIVTEVARLHGFGAPQVIVDGPSDHEVEFHNAIQGELLFGTGANTILTGRTGCHLTAEAHQRGTYLPPRY